MDGSERKPAEALAPETVAANRVKALNNVLPVLISRAGGSVTVTREEFEAVQALYAGGMTVRMEQVGDAVRLTLVAKRPAQGEAVM